MEDAGWEDDGENSVQLSNEQSRVVEVIEHEEKAHYSLIAKKTGMDVSEIAKILMKLELDGVVSRLPGNYYALRNRRH